MSIVTVKFFGLLLLGLFIIGHSVYSESMSRSCIPQKYSFFADESGISKDRFTVVGGVCLESSVVDVVYDTLEKFRIDHNMTSELKWSKISNQKQKEYEALVDMFFALNNTNHIQFHAIIFDNHTWNHSKYNNGDSDKGLSKLYYLLILHQFIKRCHNAGDLFACLDQRTSSTSLNDLRDMLNATARRDFDAIGNPLKQLISKDSKADDILQLNDVILGAVSAVRNGRHLVAGGKKSKQAIAEKVLVDSGLPSFSENSNKKINRFTIWNFSRKK